MVVAAGYRIGTIWNEIDSADRVQVTTWTSAPYLRLEVAVLSVGLVKVFDIPVFDLTSASLHFAEYFEIFTKLFSSASG